MGAGSTPAGGSKQNIETMKNFLKLQQQRPGLAETLSSLTIEELKDHYALEVLVREEQENSFNHIAKIAADFLFKNHHPHCSIYIDSGRAELLEGMQSRVFIRPIE